MKSEVGEGRGFEGRGEVSNCHWAELPVNRLGKLECISRQL